MVNKPKMNKNFLRQLIGLFLFFNGFIIIATGIVLFIMPHGRIAYWINWKFIGLNKDQWSNIHIVSALLFIIAMIFHIQFNWKAFLNYFSYKNFKISFLLKSPLAITLLSTILVIILTIYNLPPIKQVISLEKAVKKGWETKYNQPPIPHAEKLPLSKLCKFANISPSQGLKRLRKRGWKVISIKEKIKKIAEINHHSPMDLWFIIKGDSELGILENTP